MGLPVKIVDLVQQRVVESTRIEYAPYKKNNAVLELKQRYNTTVQPVIQTFLHDSRMLGTAILTDKLIENERKFQQRID